ncbi:MAG: hypothetical protein WCJ81_00615 [bacterium]
MKTQTQRKEESESSFWISRALLQNRARIWARLSEQGFSNIDHNMVHFDGNPWLNIPSQEELVVSYETPIPHPIKGKGRYVLEVVQNKIRILTKWANTPLSETILSYNLAVPPEESSVGLFPLGSY